MATSPITDADFTATIENQTDKLIIVDFWADWCGPCKMLAPVLDSLSDKLVDSVTIYKLNTDENPATAQALQIASIPCCIVYKNKKEVHRIIGHKSAEAFEAELSPYL